ncbi:MAG: hypothetical protein ACREON_13010 [Gemmatimonadaceae bacterium]
MSKTLRVRVLGAILSAVFLFAMSAQAAAVHRCPVHDGALASAPAATGDSHQHGDHASASEHGPAADRESPHCCCIGQGCCSAAIVPFAAARVAPAPLSACECAAPAGALSRSPRAPPHFLPFANGPPHTALA